jgi:hypothetical protein
LHDRSRLSSSSQELQRDVTTDGRVECPEQPAVAAAQIDDDAVVVSEKVECEGQNLGRVRRVVPKLLEPPPGEVIPIGAGAQRSRTSLRNFPV